MSLFVVYLICSRYPQDIISVSRLSHAPLVLLPYSRISSSRFRHFVIMIPPLLVHPRSNPLFNPFNYPLIYPPIFIQPTPSPLLSTPTNSFEYLQDLKKLQAAISRIEEACRPGCSAGTLHIATLQLQVIPFLSCSHLFLSSHTRLYVFLLPYTPYFLSKIHPFLPPPSPSHTLSLTHSTPLSHTHFPLFHSPSYRCSLRSLGWWVRRKTKPSASDSPPSWTVSQTKSNHLPNS